MSIHDDFRCAEHDLSYEERLAFNSHLLGGLMQEIDSGKATKTGASKAIARARDFAIRDRAGAVMTR